MSTLSLTASSGEDSEKSDGNSTDDGSSSSSSSSSSSEHDITSVQISASAVGNAESTSQNNDHKYCHVQHCRFNSTHVTSGHRCGRCGKFGHGRMECGHSSLLSALVSQSSIATSLPAELHCSLSGCRYAHSHTTSAHHCSLCGDRLHSAAVCPNVFPAAPAVVGTHATASVASTTSTSTTLNFECPVCRMKNTVSTSQQTAYNVNSGCVVCCDSETQVYLPKCGHVCLCWNCAKDLDKMS